MQTLQQGEEDALVPRGTSGVSSFPHIESISEKAAYAWHPALQVLKAALKGRALGRQLAGAADQQGPGGGTRAVCGRPCWESEEASRR